MDDIFWVHIRRLKRQSHQQVVVVLSAIGDTGFKRLFNIRYSAFDIHN